MKTNSQLLIIKFGKLQYYITILKITYINSIALILNFISF